VPLLLLLLLLGYPRICVRRVFAFELSPSAQV
jgi:hypothetical protein